MQGRRQEQRIDQRGFTLLEIAVTMAIVALILAIAVPRLPRLGRTDLEASGSRLATTMTYLADEASLRGRIYRLTLHLDAGGWTVAALSPFADTGTDASSTAQPGTDFGGQPSSFGQQQPASAFRQQPLTAFQEDADDPLARATALPDGISFDAVLDRNGETHAGEWPVYFLPEGLTEDLDVRLRDDESGERLTVRLDAAQGRAEVDEIVERVE